jgi:hypothetical protein
VWESRLIRDALTIVVGVHISRQQGQSLLHVRKRLFDLRLRYRFGPPDHRIQFEAWNQVFFENYRDFCCLNFKEVLNSLYSPSRTAYGG